MGLGRRERLAYSALIGCSNSGQSNLSVSASRAYRECTNGCRASGQYATGQRPQRNPAGGSQMGSSRER
jgi:hypothetical protein